MAVVDTVSLIFHRLLPPVLLRPQAVDHAAAAAADRPHGRAVRHGLVVEGALLVGVGLVGQLGPPHLKRERLLTWD